MDSNTNKGPEMNTTSTDTAAPAKCGYKLAGGYYFCRNRVRFVATDRYSGKKLHRCGKHMAAVYPSQYEIVDNRARS
jgi:hypothetical protein